jgi:hypothetical protein
LAEMIKISHLDIGILVSFIKAHGIRPDWLHMQLPGGMPTFRRWRHVTATAQCQLLTYCCRTHLESMSPRGREHARRTDAASAHGLSSEAQIVG